MAGRIQSTFVRQLLTVLNTHKSLGCSRLSVLDKGCSSINRTRVAPFSSSAIMLEKPKSDRKKRPKQFQYASYADADDVESLADVDLDYEPTDKTIINITDPIHRQRLQDLMQIFPRKDIKHLAARSPQVFVQPFDDICQIVTYISDSMGLDQKEMVKAGVFDYPFEHIVRRHMFAERCGVFQRVPLKKPEMSEFNPSLTSMIRTSNRDFARTIGLTMEEYEVFCEMFDEVERKTLADLAEGFKLKPRNRGYSSVDPEAEDLSDLDEDEGDDNEDYYL